MALRRPCAEQMSAVPIEDLVQELAEDNTSGAAELTRRAADVLVLLAQESTAQETTDFLSELVAAGKQVIQAQPSMAPLFNLVNSVLSRLGAAQDTVEARRITEAASKGFAADLALRGERIGQEAVSLITDRSTVMTHSRSSTVMRAFLMAKAEGRRFQVLSTESRPMLEGREVARELAGRGIETKLMIDCAVADLMGKVDLVMVGADSISAAGLVNKIGTQGVALAAAAHGVPFYALCGTEKFLPASYPYLEIEPKDPREVWHGYPEGVEVVNYYFDVTALRYLSGVVTERGTLLPAQVEELLGQLKVHEALL